MRPKEKEEQGRGCRRHPRQFLAPFSVPSAASPSAPSPALTLSPSPRRTSSQGRKEGRAPRPFWAMSSPHLAIDRTATNRGAAPRTVCHPPAHPADPLHPCRGVPGHKTVKFFLTLGSGSFFRAADAISWGRECLQNLFLSLSNHYQKNEVLKSKTAKLRIRIKW